MSSFDFNPRSRKGSDRWQIYDSNFGVFQSTLPQGERRPAHDLRQTHGHFNPRSRKGSDPGRQALCSRPDNFNPRSRKGSDARSNLLWTTLINFNPRSRKGSDRQNREIKEVLSISIHAPARGATLSATANYPGVRDFNPRSRKGSDGKEILDEPVMTHFNPRSRKGSDFIRNILKM